MYGLDDSISSLISVHDEHSEESSRKRMRRDAFNETETTRRVRFERVVEVAEIPSREDFSSDESKKAWYTSDDLNRIMEDVQQTLEMMENGYPAQPAIDDDLQFCTRGINSLQDMENNKSSMTFVKTLVLQQMAHFKIQGILDSDMIANLYHECSLPHVRKAQESAMTDAEDAKQYLQLSI